jgi:hypothetical protein
MAVDLKYGRVRLENGTIGDDEPVFVLRAQDCLVPDVLAYYLELCSLAGSPARHRELVVKGRQRVIDWQKDNPARVPDSESSRAWLGD